MRRLITYRWVRLALAATVTAVAVAVVVAVVRLRGRTARPDGRAVPGADRGTRTASGGREDPRGDPRTRPGEEAAADREAVAPWPPAPILGTPTAADLARYARRPYEPKPRPPRPPLDEATRRRVVRWGSAAVALGVLVFAAQVLETAVFSGEGPGAASPYVEEHYFRDEELPFMTAGRDCTAPTRLADGRLHALCTAPTATTAPGGGGPLVATVVPRTGRTESPSGPGRGTPARAGESPEPGAPGSDLDCAPGPGAPVVRRVDAKVTRAVNRQWARIERWLKANAPETHRTLAGPARARTIAVAEAQMGLRFPDDLKASLLRHDGSRAGRSSWGFGPMGYESLSVRQIRDDWRGLCKIERVQEGADDRGEWWDGRLIPVGSDGTGGELVVDSVRRDVGEGSFENGGGATSFTPGGVRVRSYHALLRMTADALENGGSVGHWEPVVRGGALEWRFRDGTGRG
ncbi:SMI1/KNR4 family protein [Planomonospora parontospora]|uniref:SMI1/KNR4 family protein n=1 Tax=Planomonospora parontospora TaxID=58119 RepID=UPI00167083BE|nr:SMI1/KNR4 family protein [Planomonospora parontospora]GGL04172.1 hypothetical protein GCM10014719_02900 [Planomonospora parontospora subsp. antibiotica]GII13449.1 hypothetical protein Ppa05_01750 [Planomonospora parontospora subsp. antibiotica]